MLYSRKELLGGLHMPYLSIPIDETLAGSTAHHVLKSRCSVSTDMLRRLKRQERGILINDTPALAKTFLRIGDVLSFSLDDEQRDEPIPPVDLPLEIVYEDEYLYIINKPAAMPTIPSSLHGEEPSVAGILAHLSGGF